MGDRDMEEKSYDISLMLLNEYKPVIERMLDRNSRRGRFLGADKKTQKLLKGFKAGDATLEEIQKMLAVVWAECGEALAHPKAGRIGETAVMTGARNELATAVKILTECEKENPAGNADAVMSRALSRMLDARIGR